MATRYVEPQALTMPAWRSLAVIARYGPLSAGELGRRTSSDPYRVVRAIDLLVRRQLITRDPDPADRRRARLELTAAGRRLYDEVERGAVGIEYFLRAGLTEQELGLLDSILVRIDAQVHALAHGVPLELDRRPSAAGPPAGGRSRAPSARGRQRLTEPRRDGDID